MAQPRDQLDQFDRLDPIDPPIAPPAVAPPLVAVDGFSSTRGPVVGRGLTPDQLDDLIVKAALAPASVTIDGISATRGSAVDLIALLNFAAARQRLAGRGPPMRTYRTIPPGTVGPTARPV